MIQISRNILRGGIKYINYRRMSSAYLVDDQNYSFLKELGLDRVNNGVYNGKWGGSGQITQSIDPATGKIIAEVTTGTAAELEECIKTGVEAYEVWKNVPAPRRGEIIRQIGDEFRKYLEPLGRHLLNYYIKRHMSTILFTLKKTGKLVSLEMGKILPEGVGEVQEFIDICDYAVGLSRMFAGQVLPSERSDHIILEKWRPLGLIGVITAFNFPCAVYGWNSAIAMVVGNSVLWKGAPTTSLVSVASTKIVADVFKRNNFPPVATLCSGGADIGQTITSDNRIKLVSFTGSTKIGQQVEIFCFCLFILFDYHSKF